MAAMSSLMRRAGFQFRAVATGAVATAAILAAAPVCAQAATGAIATVAGTGLAGYAGDGAAATRAEVSYPNASVLAPTGSIWIADYGNNVIRAVAPDGTVATIAGVAGPGGFSGDGGLATSARLDDPTGIGPSADGGYLIADRANNRIRKVSAAGIITTIAGSGAACAVPTGSCGDGGPATQAAVSAPDGVVATPDGGFLIVEDQGNRIRKVSAAGMISTVAGTGVACTPASAACGDGGPATSARFDGPTAVAVMPDGGFVVADSGDNRVRRVSAASVVTTIAGNGVAGSYGSGIAATSANLNEPSSVAVAPNGSVVIADTYSDLVRIVAAGTIRTLAGIADSPCTAPTGACGDGGAATSARLDAPYGVSVTPDGGVLISDTLDQRVRRVDAGLGGSPTIAVENARLVNAAGAPVQLRGVNRAAFESRCTYDSSGVADGPVDQASVSAMLTWKIDVVRVTVNEDCWLGINGLPLGGNAAGYRAAVTGYVDLLRANGLYVIVETHTSAPGTIRSTGIDYMPDNDHMPTLWASIAQTFKADHGVVFDPINEVAMASWNNPQPSPAGEWACWLKGCTLDSIYGGRFVAAGLQTLVGVIRAQGATQPILLGGMSYNSDFSQLLGYLPTDPQHQLVASAHVYDFAEGSGIDAIFTGQLEPIAKRLPVILGELGERNCDSGMAAYTSHVLSLVDGEAAKGNIFGVLGWTWNAHTSASTGWQCPTDQYGDGGPLLIRDYAGTPTVMGGVLRSWITARAGNP
jgi:hypothetical protein